ncbi:hypothetical protein ACJIZ3_015736 [Penstemon smallii]|uniref:Basic blue protein n=1 Tax=Penstemon smallii TaxID=265156 RepID=A0ABD3RNL1_9LAMI
MAQGRGSALLVAMVMVVVVVVFHCGVVQAATFKVGDGGGWTFNMVAWPNGKRFRAGDTLLFNYNSGIHNVVKVNKAGYDGCSTPGGSTMYQTGKDQIKLAKGQNFFICNFPGHCGSGMKIAITAT